MKVSASHFLPPWMITFDVGVLWSRHGIGMHNLLTTLAWSMVLGSSTAISCSIWRRRDGNESQYSTSCPTAPSLSTHSTQVAGSIVSETLPWVTWPSRRRYVYLGLEPLHGSSAISGCSPTPSLWPKRPRAFHSTGPLLTQTLFIFIP